MKYCVAVQLSQAGLDLCLPSLCFVKFRGYPVEKVTKDIHTKDINTIRGQIKEYVGGGAGKRETEV